MIEYILVYKNRLINETKQQLNLVSERVLEIQSCELANLLDTFAWTNQIEKWLIAYSQNKADLKHCFKLFEISRTRDLVSKKEDIEKKISSFVTRLNEDLEKQVGCINLKKSEISEIEKLARISSGNFLSADLDANQSRRKSLLRSNNQNVLETTINAKPADFSVNDGRRNLLRNQSNTKIEGLRQELTPMKLAHQFSAVTLNPYTGNENTIDEYRSNQPYAPNDHQVKIQKVNSSRNPTPELDNRRRTNNESNFISDRLQYGKNGKESSQNDISKIPNMETEADDEDLIASGLFDNADLKNFNSNPIERSPSKKVPIVRNQLGYNNVYNPGTQSNANFTSSASVFKTPRKPNYTLTNSNENSIEKNKSVNVERKPTLSNNKKIPIKTLTPNKLDKTRESALKLREFFNREPIKSVLKKLETNNLCNLILTSLLLTDDHLAEICLKIKGKTVLESIDLSTNRISDRGIEKLFEILHTTSVHTLKMAGNELTNNALKACYGFVGRPYNQLKTIDIKPCRIEKDFEGRMQIKNSFKKRGVTISF